MNSVLSKVNAAGRAVAAVRPRRQASPAGGRWSALAAASAALLLVAACSSDEDALAGAGQAQQLLEAGRLEEAERAIAAVAAEHDDVAQVYLVQGRIAYARGAIDSAYQAFYNALALETTNPEALIAVSQLGLRTGRLREAEDAADRLLLLDPRQPQALMTKGVIALARRDRARAGDYADQILAAQPNDESGLILKARVLAINGDRDAAAALIRDAVGRTGYTAGLTGFLVELHRARGEGDQFLAMLQRLRASGQADPDRLIDLADTLYKTGRIDQAREQAADLLGPNATDRAVLSKVIRLWQAYDPDPLPPALLDRLARTSSVEARMAAGRHLIETGRAQAAVDLLRPVATGWSSEIQALMARALDAASPAGTMSPQAAAMLARDPENGDLLMIRARHSMEAGRAKDAIVDLQRVVRNYPEWGAGRRALGDAYRANGSEAGFRRAFEDGLKANPQNLPLAAAYVERLGAIGDGERAIEVARRFARQSPALEPGWRLFAAACGRLPASGCREEVREGLERSRTLFGLDPAVGAARSRGLLDRLA